MIKNAVKKKSLARVLMENIEKISAQDVLDIMGKNQWVAQVNARGVWVIGPESDSGTINILGMGPTFMDSFKMARKCLA